MIDPAEYKGLVRQSAVIIIAAFLLGLAINVFHPKGFVLVSRESLERKKIVGITTDEAKHKFDRSSGLFIDTRDGDDFAAGRIRGAINVPAHPESLTMIKLKEYFDTISSPQELVLYCDAGCDSSESIAAKIIGLGYSRNVYVLKDGMKPWVDRGFPVDNGR